MSRALYQAFMEPSKTGEAPLIKRIAGVVILVERSNWATKIIMKGFVIAVSIMGAIATYMSMKD